MRNFYTPGLHDPGPQGDDQEGCTGIMMSMAMGILGAMAMIAVMVTNGVNKRRHAVVNMSAHDAFIVAAVAIVGAVLLVLPASAQCDAECGSAPEPPVAAVQSSTLYLPEIAWRFPMWFTDAELAQAQADAGYDVEVAQMHTVCYLAPSSTPPHDLRYSSCEQYWVDGVPTEDVTPAHYIWWLRLNDGKLHSVEVGGTMVQDSGTDAPCYTEDDGEVACG